MPIAKRENNKHNYCSDCGEKMLLRKVCANTIEIYHYDSFGGDTFILGYEFNRTTGKKNYADVYQCPNYKKRWFGDNGHEIFCIYKGEHYYAITLK